MFMMILYKTSENIAIPENVPPGSTPGVPLAGSGAGPVASELPQNVVTSGFDGSPWYTSEITQPPPPVFNQISYLEKWHLQKAGKSILGWSRFNHCHSTPVGSSVDLVKHRDSDKAHFKGLATCGSVWVCPVCASKITERRRQELEAAIKTAESHGLEVHLLTLTIPHGNNDSLGELLKKFNQARRLMKNRKGWKSWTLRVGLVGSVRALEVTQGNENGWHVHSHEILFCRSVNRKKSFSGSSYLGSTDRVHPVACPDSVDVLPFWKGACSSVGLKEPNVHGVDIRRGNYAVGDYVSKWGISSEATKSMIKKGRQGNRSPWDLLREYISNGDEDEAARFKEYADAFKGKRQLVWSDGLRSLLGLEVEKTDEQIAAEVEAGSDVVASLTLKEWRRVCRHHYDLRGQLLLVARHGAAAVKDFLNLLMIENSC